MPQKLANQFVNWTGALVPASEVAATPHVDGRMAQSLGSDAAPASQDLLVSSPTTLP